MFKIIVFVLLAISSQSLANLKISEDVCGIRPLFEKDDNSEMIGSRIVGGSIAIPGDWGWSISLTQLIRHVCGGVLINKDYVLTAAHCFEIGYDGKPTYPPGTLINIGIHNRNAKESWVQQRYIKKVYIHEKFNANTLSHDIALVRLSDPAKIDDKYIVPVCLDENEDLLPELDPKGKQTWLTGWGNERYLGTLSPLKKQVNMTIFDDQKCKYKYGDAFDPVEQLCGGEYEDESGACQGDSGGPMVLKSTIDGRWYLMGLISWGFSCGIGTVYVNVRNFLPWIREKIQIDQSI